MMKKTKRILFLFLIACVGVMALSACDKTPAPTPETKTKLGKIVITRETTSNSLMFSWKAVENASSYDFYFVLGDEAIHTDNIEQEAGKTSYSVTLNPTVITKVGEYYAYVTAKANPEKYTFSTSESYKLSVPLGSLPEFPIEIRTVADFEKIHSNPMSYNYILMADLDFNNAVIKPIGYNKSSSNVGSNKEYYYTGTFNGNNHTIKNFQLQSFEMDLQSDLPCIGLFKYLSNAKILDLTIVNAYSASHEGAVVQKEDIGILAGVAVNSQIKNVNVVNSNIYWETPHVGYKVGNSVTTISPTVVIGGLIGRSYNSNVIEKCSFSGSIKVESFFSQSIFDQVDDANLAASLSNYRVGGLIGFADIDSKAHKNLSIDRCYFDGRIDIVGHNIYVGGLVGDITGKFGAGSKKYVEITNSYAKGTMAINAEEGHDNVTYHKRIGLLVGRSDFNIINKCYADVAVSLKEFAFDKVNISDNVGTTSKYTRTFGFIGFNVSEGENARSTSNCYFNDTINKAYSESLVCVGGFPHPSNNNNHFDITKINETAKLYDKDTYKGWDFDTIWQLNDNKMPTLR